MTSKYYIISINCNQKFQLAKNLLMYACCKQQFLNVIKKYACYCSEAFYKTLQSIFQSFRRSDFETKLYKTKFISYWREDVIFQVYLKVWTKNPFMSTNRSVVWMLYYRQMGDAEIGCSSHSWHWLKFCPWKKSLFLNSLYCGKIGQIFLNFFVLLFFIVKWVLIVLFLGSRSDRSPDEQFFFIRSQFLSIWSAILEKDRLNSKPKHTIYRTQPVSKTMTNFVP